MARLTKQAAKHFEKSRVPVRIRMMGGSVPTDKLVDALGVPFIIVPMVSNDNNQHSFDENLRIGHLLDFPRCPCFSAEP
jgi:hypothetical protein